MSNNNNQRNYNSSNVEVCLKVRNLERFVDSTIIGVLYFIN